MSDADFSRRSLVAIVVVCAGSLLTAALLTAFLEPEETESYGSDSYSVSALGHSAFVELLKGVDIPVLVSRHDSGSRARSGLLVVAEPILDSAAGKRADALRTMAGRAKSVLLVLPKWQGVKDIGEKGWISDVYPVEVDDVETVLEAFEIEARVVRTGAPGLSALPGVAPPAFPTDEVQLVSGATLTAVFGGSEGDLFVDVAAPKRRLFVLSDPDVLSNAGLHRGGNAELVLAAIERARPKGGTVVLDETMHGYESPPSLTRELLTPPLAFGTLHLLVVLTAVLWAAWGRFGAPIRPAPALEPGTRTLIQNTADLLRWGGHAGDALPRYLAHAIRDVRAALQAPATLAGDALDAWIDRVAATRGATLRLADVRKEAASAARTGPSARILAAAAEVHRWREEIVHGAGGRPQHP